jgi:hypothetical protein
VGRIAAAGPGSIPILCGSRRKQASGRPAGGMADCRDGILAIPRGEVAEPGLRRTPGERVLSKGSRGFKSPPLRHTVFTVYVKTVDDGNSAQCAAFFGFQRTGESALVAVSVDLAEIFSAGRIFGSLRSRGSSLRRTIASKTGEAGSLVGQDSFAPGQLCDRFHSPGEQVVRPAAPSSDRLEQREINHGSGFTIALDDQTHLEAASPYLHRKLARESQLAESCFAEDRAQGSLLCHALVV